MISGQTVALCGPNRWSRRSVLELYLAGDIANRGVPSIGRFTAPLREFLDSGRYTTTHANSVATSYRILDRLDESQSTTFAFLLLRVAEWMSAMSGVPVQSLEPAPSLSTRDDCVCDYALPIEMEVELLSHRCFALAHELIETVHRGEVFPIAAKFRELFDYADDVRLGPSSRAILDAAVERGIPTYRLTSGSLCQLGEGTHQRRIWTAETDATSAIAESIASDKDLTKRLLRNVGVPVPLGRMVHSPEDAWKAALEVGLPVVVKPKDANHQRGISIELTKQEEVMQAYHWAIEDGQTTDVMVEQFARGQHHRLLVVGNQMVAASRGHWETVTGDGHSTIEHLVHVLNQDPRRGEAYTDPLGVVKLDAAAKIELSKQGLSIEAIPESGRVVLVRRTGDLTTDCTEQVHPITVAQAVLAAQTVGLDIAGLDVLAEDISKPLFEQRGAVVEVNAGPSLTPHVVPLFGKPRPVGEAVVNMLFPNNRPHSIPICGIVTYNEDDACLAEVNRWLTEEKSRNRTAGVVHLNAIRIGELRIELPEYDANSRARAMIGHPSVESILIVLTPRDLIEHGLPLPRLDQVYASHGTLESIRKSADEEVFEVLRNSLTTEAWPMWLKPS